MIVVTIPINSTNECLDRLMAQLNHLVKYHPSYAGQEFSVQKIHLSLVKIDGCAERNLLSHIQEIIREHLPSEML